MCTPVTATVLCPSHKVGWKAVNSTNGWVRYLLCRVQRPKVHHTASKLAPIIYIRLFQETLYYRQMKQSHKKIGTIEAASKTDSRIERQTQK